ncbi:gluconeogenesis factor YvcK family protein [Traorella massiliensis]|uniref:gluconeogenesis factor YvcK family protein n=1 Tax=Traorella massiliensis TaxID=1903263 RepID=UPI0008F950F0|nr:gluconeogenesis factor YvcK family protein [Traorella massiliensis]
MKNVVVIGGGSGQSVILKGLKQVADINITTIVTVADDGGSTGRLRRQFHIPAMGDIRNVMCALAKEETLFTHLMEYRFEGEDDVGGHNLGNLILTALTEKEGSFMDAISEISKILNVKGTILPATTQVITLFARMSDGTVVRGESNIPNFDNRIREIFYDEKVEANPEAMDAIIQADVIFIGIGSLYTSVIPCLIIDGICDAIKKSKATRYYMCNAMSQPGETDYYSVEDHVEALEKHTFKGIVPNVIVAPNNASDSLLKKYENKGFYPVKIKQNKHDYNIILEDLLDVKGDFIRHDPVKIRDFVIKLLKES